MTTASTQLRALEGEIEQINKEIGTEGRPYGNLAWRITKSLLTDRLLTIAKELEKRAIHAETQAHVAEMEVKLVKNERDALKRRMDEAMKAAQPMFETVDMRRNPHQLQERADFLIERGWTPIPFTPQGAPDGVVAKITHPSQRWQKNGHCNRITEQALKIELRNDTDNLRTILTRITEIDKL